MRHAICIVLFLLSATVSAQELFIPGGFSSAGISSSTETGKVGIGVSAPAEKLHINGAIRGNAAGGALTIRTPYGYLDIGPMNESWSHLQTDRPRFYFNKPITVDGAINSYHSQDLLLGTFGVTRIRALESNGYVSIGALTPTAKLHVQQSGGGWADGLRLSLQGNDWDIVSDIGGERLLIAKGQTIENGLALWQNKVGIGVASPDAKLHIASGMQAIKFLTGSNSSWYDLAIGVNDDGVNFQNNSTIRGFNFKNINGTLVTIGSNGNVGIGTPTPGSFKLAVNGKIWTQEVSVAMTNPGPDYVFEEDYNLLSLPELEAYIKQNKHLPEVPSAKQMDEDGLNLKEMNLILLKKVEELTLHLIDQDKKIETLQESNDSLRSQNREILLKLKTME